MTFRDFLDDLELLWGPHAPTADRLRVHGHDDALAFLQGVVDEPHERARLRAIVGRELGHDLTHMTDADVLSAAAHFVESGRLLPSQPSQPDDAHARGTPGGVGPRPIPNPSQPAPPSSRPTPALTYFEARYTDEIGEAIAGASVEIVVAEKHARVTDGDGRCRLDGVREDFGNTRATDLAALREILRPRWDTIREEPWLEAQADHTFVPLEEGEHIGGQLLSETLHTVVVQPWCIRARLSTTRSACSLLRRGSCRDSHRRSIPSGAGAHAKRTTSRSASLIQSGCV